MRKECIKIGIIGAGFITGTQHIPSILKLNKRAKVMAIADNRQDALEYMSKYYDIEKVYTDPFKMLEENELDLVHVCTANNTHKEFTIAALKAGAHVLCEKPLALKLKDAEEMYAEANRAGKILMTCQNSRIGAIQAIKEIIRADSLGDIYFVEIENIRRRGVPTWGRFHNIEDNGGGPFCDLGVHYLDAAIFALGNPRFKSVSANTYSNIAPFQTSNHETIGAMEGEQPYLPRDDYNKKDFSVEDYATGMVRFDNGMQMQMKFAWAVNLPKADIYRFAGTKKGLLYRKGEGLLNPIIIYGQDGEYLTDTEYEVPIAKPGAMQGYGHYEVFTNMIDTIEGKTECLIKKEETLNVVGVIEAFYLSAKLGREIRLDELDTISNK